MAYEATKRGLIFSAVVSIIIATFLSKEICAYNLAIGILVGLLSYATAETRICFLGLPFALLSPILFTALINTDLFTAPINTWTKVLSGLMIYFIEFAVIAGLCMSDPSELDTQASRQTP